MAEKNWVDEWLANPPKDVSEPSENQQRKMNGSKPKTAPKKKDA